jgi:hypothetical protein
MIKKKTTLILGAGASAPFEFPTGYDLLRRVIGWSEYDIDPITTLYSGFSKTEIDAFREALRRSGKTSVDAFLEYRPEFIPVGKTAMAWALIQCEHEPHLFKRDGKSWYEYLFNQLSAQFEDFGQNRLSILTFNYDRSLEHYLFTALKNSSGKSENECADKLKTIPIIHLHGDLGVLPHTGTALARPYNTNISPEVLNIATKRIKIIHEGIENERQFELAHHFLSESEVICFLGFGYHPLNMERLGIKSGSSSSLNGKQIIGSSFGFTHAESNQISGRYGFQLRPNQYEYQNLDVLQFLRETGVLHGN